MLYLFSHSVTQQIHIESLSHASKDFAVQNLQSWGIQVYRRLELKKGETPAGSHLHLPSPICLSPSAMLSPSDLLLRLGPEGCLSSSRESPTGDSMDPTCPSLPCLWGLPPFSLAGGLWPEPQPFPRCCLPRDRGYDFLLILKLNIYKHLYALS